MTSAPIIFWFRRDLRLDDNIGLQHAISSGQPVLPIFIIDPRLQGGIWYSRNRMALLLSTLEALNARLRQYGTCLRIMRGNPEQILPQLAQRSGAAALYFNRDYSPFARERDQQVARLLDIPVHSFDDNLLVAPGQLLKKDGKPYSVYSPFKRRWRSMAIPPISKLVLHPENFSSIVDLHSADSARQLAEAKAIAQPHVPLPPAAESIAQRRLANFMSDGSDNYQHSRNHLTIDPFTETPENGPSALSPYLRLGILSPRQLYWAARDRLANSFTESARQSIEVFCDQLIWREFFMHIMYHFPQVRQGNFRRDYDKMAWREAPQELAAWQQGRSGYPIVDAAMRQLNSIGWMPNRARMIVASFLSKDLLIDWRAGEAYFMQHLLDGDPAANNGGWQWAAGTGTDAQPYFRIFNPVRQSKKFDPDGRYLRHWLPELRELPDSLIHQPWEAQPHQLDYPEPIVDHRFARDRALSAFKAAREDMAVSRL